MVMRAPLLWQLRRHVGTAATARRTTRQYPWHQLWGLLELRDAAIGTVATSPRQCASGML